MEPLVSPFYPSFRGSSSFEPLRPLELEPFSDSWEAFLVDDLLDFSNNDICSPNSGDCSTFLRLSAENASAPTAPNAVGSESSERCSRAPLSVLEVAPASAEPLYSPVSSPPVFWPFVLEVNPSTPGALPDELAELDWLSPFVEEDSYAADKSLAPFVHLNYEENKIACGRNERDLFQSKSPVSVLEESNAFGTYSRSILGWRTVVKGRSRSKRSRTGARVWSLHMLTPLPSDRNSADEKPVFEDSSEDSQSSSLEYEAGDFSRPKKKPNKSYLAKKSSLDSSQARKCSHCQVQKTPQWRAGPLGPKTLCNACGVRYKSGRLVPEYRPAASPSFVSEVHSNSHKKILEMRRYKDQELGDVTLYPEGLDHEIMFNTSDLSEESEEPNSSEQTMTSNLTGDV